MVTVSICGPTEPFTKEIGIKESVPVMVNATTLMVAPTKDNSSIILNTEEESSSTRTAANTSETG
jgi:hypothetical protein